MKEIEIIEIPMTNDQKVIDGFFQQYYNKTERYYVGYENDPTKQCSVMFSDLKWLRKHFGVDRNEDSPITFDSLNAGRKNEILNYKNALIRNCAMWDMDCFNDNNTVKTYEDDDGVTKTYNFCELSEQGKQQFQTNIDKGLLVLCKLV